LFEKGINYFYIARGLTVFLLLVNAINAFSQSGWGEWEKIFNDEYIVVEVQYYLSDSSCEDEGRQFKYRTRVTGQYRAYPYFLNWKMNYFDCNGNLFYQVISTDVWKTGGGGAFGDIYESLDNRFTGMKILQPFYDPVLSKSRKYESGYLPKCYSIKAYGIDTLTMEDSVLLTIRGGYLGATASWCWHENDCKGRIVARGDSVKVKPEETTTYFLNAEGEGCQTKCVQMKIIVIRKIAVVEPEPEPEPDIVPEPEPEPVVVRHINTDSIVPPKEILGPKSICKGDSTILRVSRGRLNQEGQWVWYSSESHGKRIGNGEFIYIKPEKKTKYFVRGESLECTTKKISFEIEVIEKSDIHYAIVYKGKPEICEGTKVEFEVDNYIADFDGIWNWYSDSCNCEVIASGAFVEFYPTRTTTYYLRRDGICNLYQGDSLTVFVKQKSRIDNARIMVPDTVYKNEPAVLVMSGGKLGAGAQWYWYQDSITAYNFLGKGDSLTIKSKRKHRYIVIAYGPCNDTQYIETVVKPLKHLRKSTQQKIK